MPLGKPELTLLAALLLVSYPASGNGQISRQELALVQQYIEQQASSITKSVPKFTSLTQPYAPLDFEIRQANNKHASDVRNNLFGYAGATAKLDDSVTPKMANDFHCGPPCASERIKLFLEQNQQVSALVQRFLSQPKLDIVAQWGITGDFRINDTLIQHGIVTTFAPVGASGILPNSEGKIVSSLPAATGLATTEIADAKALTAELAALHLSAIVRSPQGIRVIRTGNSDNQCGLLFKRLSVPEPKAGDSFGEGLEIVGITKLAQDIYYFETT